MRAACASTRSFGPGMDRVAPGRPGLPLHFPLFVAVEVRTLTYFLQNFKIQSNAKISLLLTPTGTNECRHLHCYIIGRDKCNERCRSRPPRLRPIMAIAV